VIVHIQSTMDFDPLNPSPPPSPPDSDDGDSGHDSNPDRHHFSCGSERRVLGFRCVRGVVDDDVGEPGGNNTGSTRILYRDITTHTRPTQAGRSLQKRKSKSGCLKPLYYQSSTDPLSRCMRSGKNQLPSLNRGGQSVSNSNPQSILRRG